MDDGKGTFIPVEAKDNTELLKKLAALKEENPGHGGVFRVGEEIQLRGSLFRVKSIKPKELRLKLLKR